MSKTEKPITLETLMNSVLETSSKIFLSAKNSKPDEPVVIPIFFLSNDEGIFPVAVEMKDKNVIAQAVRELAHKLKAKRFVFVSEGYMLVGKDAAKEFNAAGSVRQAPSRIEAITVTGQDTVTGESGTFYRQILRPEHGTPTLAPRKGFVERGSPLAGRFGDLLPRE